MRTDEQQMKQCVDQYNTRFYNEPEITKCCCSY